VFAAQANHASPIKEFNGVDLRCERLPIYHTDERNLQDLLITRNFFLQFVNLRLHLLLV
jgi:hypothetical protein